MSTYLQHGSEGDLVSALQEALNNQGYDLEVDGSFGDAPQAMLCGSSWRLRGALADGTRSSAPWQSFRATWFATS